jgi:ribonuclease-3
VLEEKGPEHDKVFTVGARVNNNLVGIGVSGSKKDAEMKAAEEALRLFGVNQ